MLAVLEAHRVPARAGASSSSPRSADSWQRDERRGGKRSGGQATLAGFSLWLGPLALRPTPHARWEPIDARRTAAGGRGEGPGARGADVTLRALSRAGHDRHARGRALGSVNGQVAAIVRWLPGLLRVSKGVTARSGALLRPGELTQQANRTRPRSRACEVKQIQGTDSVRTAPHQPHQRPTPNSRAHSKDLPSRRFRVGTPAVRSARLAQPAAASSEAGLRTPSGSLVHAAALRLPRLQR